jgi:hypothetical protein
MPRRTVIVSNLTDALKVQDDALAEHFGFPKGREYIALIMNDRASGGSQDLHANVCRDEYHRFLGELSKSELIDLVLEIHGNDFRRPANRFFDDLVNAIGSVLNTRYLNRHPEEWESE